MRECPKCRAPYDLPERACSKCEFEFRATPEEKGFPLIFYPIAVLFGIYLLWELAERLFSAH